MPIYELRTYTLVPGKQTEYLRLNRDVGRPARGDRFGKLEGGWTTDIGPLNQYVHLWSYPDLNERERLRAALAGDAAWKEYIPQIRPLMLTQESKIMSAADGVPFTPPIGGERHVYELRTYRTHPGKAAEWISHFKVGLKAREKYSKIVGLWSTDIGAPVNQVVHLWAYSDLNHRADVRAKATQDPEWQAFLGKGTPLIADMQSIILTPTEVSPLK